MVFRWVLVCGVDGGLGVYWGGGRGVGCGVGVAVLGCRDSVP